MAAHLRHTYHEPPHFHAHNGNLYIHKKHLIDLGWVPSWQSSKKVEKKWKPLDLGIHLAPKFSGARGGTYIQEELRCAARKTWIYVGNHMELAKQARVLDPTQMVALPSSIEQFALLFREEQRAAIVDNGEWKLYGGSVCASVP